MGKDKDGEGRSFFCFQGSEASSVVLSNQKHVHDAEEEDRGTSTRRFLTGWKFFDKMRGKSGSGCQAEMRGRLIMKGICEMIAM